MTKFTPMPPSRGEVNAYRWSTVDYASVTLLWSEIMGGCNTPDTMVEIGAQK